MRSPPLAGRDSETGFGKGSRSFERIARNVRTLEELNSCFRAEVRKFGFTAFAGGCLTVTGSSRRFSLLDWPRAWLELYAAAGFAEDDLAIAQAMVDPAPFTWSEIKKRRPGASARIFAAAAEFGWRDGLVVPVHGRGSDRGVVSLAAPHLQLNPSARAEVVLLSLVPYERARDLEGAGPVRAERLTAREREALTLVAAGLTDEEIGRALGVSSATAHFHVEGAKRRLGARTRAHAVALALTGSLL